MPKCKHANTDTGEPRGYSHGVAVTGAAMEPRAAGGITVTETCSDCGASREINKNGRWREYGPWRVDGEAV